MSEINSAWRGLGRLSIRNWHFCEGNGVKEKVSQKRKLFQVKGEAQEGSMGDSGEEWHRMN